MGSRLGLVASLALFIGCGARTGLEVDPPVVVEPGNNAYRVIILCNYVSPCGGAGGGVGTPFSVDPVTGELLGQPICLPPELNENLVGPGVATPEALLADCETRLIPLFAGVLRGIASCPGGEEACAVSCECHPELGWISRPYNDPSCDSDCPVIEPDPTDRHAWKFVTVSRPTPCDEVFGTDPRPVCRPPVSDPPVPAPEGGLLAMIGPQSTGVVRGGVAQVTINGETRPATVGGQVDFHGTPCPDDSCNVGMSFNLTATPVQFTGGFLGLGDVTIEDIRTGGAGLPGVLTLDASGHGTYPVGTVQASGRGTAVERFLGVELSRTTAAFLFQNTAEIGVDVDWEAKTFQIVDEFSLPPGDDPESDPAVSIEVSVHGDLVNQPPTARITTRSDVECTSSDGAVVVLDGRGTTDPDDNIEAFVWRRGPAILDPAPSLAHGPVVSVLQAPLTDETYSLVVFDEHFKLSTSSVDVGVIDTTAPEIGAVTVAPDCLWPPNHKWVRLVLGEHIQAEVSDSCDPTPVVRISSVESSEPEDDRGDGSTRPDILFGETGVCLRSERSGRSLAGRVYTVTLTADDRSENDSTATVTIRVPRDATYGCEAIPPHEALSDSETESLCTFGPAIRPPEPPRQPPRVLGAAVAASRAAPPTPGAAGGCTVSVGSADATTLVLFAWLVVAIRRRRCVGC